MSNVPVGIIRMSWCGHMFSFLLVGLPGVKLLGPMVCLCLNFKKLLNFSKVSVLFAF